MRPGIDFDLNKFSREWGLIVFPISMSRISNSQGPKEYLKHLRHLSKKVSDPKVGIHFLYTDGLYMNRSGSARELKNANAAASISHANGMRRIIQKHNKEFQIQNAFSFDSWHQMYLQHSDFMSALSCIKTFYQTDMVFKNLVQKEISALGKGRTSSQISFFLEEHTLAYLLLKKEIHLRNDFVLGRESWILIAYPGPYSKAQEYLFNKDPLKIGDGMNLYAGHYNLATHSFHSYRERSVE
jgi:hypothetical protein